LNFRSFGGQDLFSVIATRLFANLNAQDKLVDEEELLLFKRMLAPFMFLVMRSAQEVPRLARSSSITRLPKDLCRMVGGMFVE
jgi:hypothetical protein